MILNAYRSARAASQLSLAQRFRWFWTFLSWQKRVASDVPLPSPDAPCFTAILLSYKRPQNIRPIVQSLLRVPEIATVVVSNNNPDIQLAEWTGDMGPRVRSIDQHIRRDSSFRMSLARRDDASYFLLLDDDVFLLPSQYSLLCRALLKDPSVPHGVMGQIYDSWLDRMHYGVHDHAGKLDVVSRVIACTKHHIEEYFRIFRTIPSRRMFADDIMLSHAGSGLPQSHRVGETLTCPTWDHDAICHWKHAGYFTSRMKLFALLRRSRE